MFVWCGQLWLVCSIQIFQFLRYSNLFVELLSVAHVVSINNDVLSKVLICIKSMDMWSWWLVHGPVVEWWVPYWVGGLCKFDLLDFLLDVNIIMTNSHVKTKIFLAHDVLHGDGIYSDWDALAFLLCNDLLIDLLLLESKFINAYTDGHI